MKAVLKFAGASVTALALLLGGCGMDTSEAGTSDSAFSEESTGTQSATVQEVEENSMESFTMPNGKVVYLHIPQAVKENPSTKVPMVLFMCGTTCDPVDNCVDSGWISLSEKENIIVVSPDYNNYATYSETPFLISVVEYMLEHYPVDVQRVYSTGFSNGGAASVALTRDYPQYFAAISAMGWMVGLDDQNGVYERYDMPFQVVQGSGEFTEQLASGSVAVMDDEKEGIRDLMLYNGLISNDETADYDKTPYWGYEPDETASETMAGWEWSFSNYYKEGYDAPFAQLVIVEDREHRPREGEAEVAWNFFKNFRRSADGSIESTSLNVPREQFNLAYDTLSEAQKLDLYLPETGNGPFPLVVFIHGGGWYGGDKTDGQESAWLTLREHGYAVASLNYRLSGEAPHPAGLIDCKTAIRYLKANAEQFGIDPNRVAVAGDSSGGHYALMVALTAGISAFEDLSRGNEQETAAVQCAVVWYPATDLAETMRTVQNGEYTGFGASFAWSNIERYIGKTITDINDEALILASPVHYISEDMPPVLLQHGNADNICPLDQSQRFYRTAVEVAGEEQVSMDILDKAGHGDAAFETEENMERVRAFLDKYL